jgi:class 3 adenylate cyclase
MIAAGRETMEAFLAGATELTPRLAAALAEWRAGDGAPPRHPVTFLFVDVAPFADPALIRDEVLVQNAINIRNRLFRAALAEFGGTEIRQTLRGLMAAFPDTKRGVDAAVKMQVDALTHTQTNADLPVHLQTGLDCGDSGDDDRRVPDAAETAAWICRKAQRDQILVSSSVREGAVDHSLPFREAGTLARENLYDAIPLFEVVWKAAGNPKELERAR